MFFDIKEDKLDHRSKQYILIRTKYKIQKT